MKIHVCIIEDEEPDIAEKAGGFLKILPEKDRFTLCVLLPLEDGDSI